MNTRALKKQLKYMVPELRLALIRESGIEPKKINGPLCLNELVEPMRLLPEEHFVTFHLDTKNQVIGWNQVSKATVSAILVHPREVFKAALLSNATAIICAHNHPSGKVSPSPEDIQTTRTLIKAGELLGVHVLDHLIVGGESICYMRDSYGHLWP